MAMCYLLQEAVANLAAAALEAVRGTKYVVGSASNVLCKFTNNLSLRDFTYKYSSATSELVKKVLFSPNSWSNTREEIL